MIRAALYERVSTEEQALHGYSIQAQVDALTDYCAAHQIKVVGHYTDEGVSGGKPMLKRPAMLRLIRDVEAGRVDLILFCKLDRWFRSVKDYYKVQEILDDHRVNWRTILQDYDTTTGDGRFKINIMLSVAQQELSRTSERIKFVYSSRISKGCAMTGGKCLPPGYIKQIGSDGRPVLVKDPQTQEAVQAFWDTLIATHNRYTAQHAMESHGLYRSISVIRDMVDKSPFYTGTYRGVANYCPAYITPEQLAACRAGNIKHAPSGRVYLFSGLVRCPSCGHRLQNMYCKSHYKDRVYECNRLRCTTHTTDPKKCSYNCTVAEDLIERQLLDHLDQYIADAVSSIQVERTRRASARSTATAASLRERQRRLTTAYLAGAFSDDDYRSQFAALTAQITAAEQTAPDTLPDTTALESLHATDYRTMYTSLTRPERQQFWHQLLAEIHLSSHTVTRVVFRFD